MVKYALDLAMHQPPCEKLSQPSPLQLVIQDVVHLNATFN